VNGEYYTDEYQRQGVTINAYDDKAALVKVVGVSMSGGSAIVNTTSAVKATKVIENGRVYILRGNQRYTITGAIAE
jgi:hypothetical protein